MQHDKHNTRQQDRRRLLVVTPQDLITTNQAGTLDNSMNDYITTWATIHNKRDNTINRARPGLFLDIIILSMMKQALFLDNDTTNFISWIIGKIKRITTGKKGPTTGKKDYIKRKKDKIKTVEQARRIIKRIETRNYND